MEIKDILDAETIKTDIQATTKEGVLRELSQLLLDNGYITDIDGFLTDIYKREEQGPTGIGNYIAIPHGNSDYVNKIGVAIGVSKKEVEWETLDGKGVKGIILFSVDNKNDGAKSHLKLLSLFARKLGNDEVVNKVLGAQASADIIEAFAN